MPARRRHRRRERARRRRRLAVVVFLLAAGVVALSAGSFGGAASINRSCDLQALQPASIGSNTFVYAADGSVLGSIPAEKNR